jgi:hypothetical protein
MLLTQKFHSLNEIDPEFIPAIEQLMHEHCVDFAAWKTLEKETPADETFNYWLFFGPTQNSPVGIAQVAFKKLNTDQYLPWWKKISGVFDKNLSKWKLARWQLCDGADGSALFDQRFARTGKEKLNELFKELEARDDVMAMSITTPHAISPYRPQWLEIPHENKAQWLALVPLERKSRDYQYYLSALPAEDGKTIRDSWKKLHKDSQVIIGDFPTIESRSELYQFCSETDKAALEKFNGGLLTFQKGNQLLGVIHYQEGQQGTFFIEPMPFEAQGEEIVGDNLYVQYGILKAHEISQVRKIIVCRQGRPLRLENNGEAQFFRQQGFITKDVYDIGWSRSDYIK